ncbi:MAG: TetR family transcriptional regulator [Mesorhizobium sp.]|uniref:TetR family transcriptional regulator C-terminal domain-containing protein n=1 Tax=Mesorhizobium sp. TaxID=1871066 RepID=UPI000FE7CF8C|nr:TetR family transcriptional regulator C-terminal domain-containing protein [Mesorhizobium sp.]RWN36479.1 MAG: TetR family transcriptional regulator [Mesorhizobium sp.]RWP01508.1 MAG: TetR family transcriptional regulator [Mesorhizobium sp.]TIT39655.1 MAG: TetR family transcriptional regulator [Mesorhizobium sp.]TIU15740.1 MAG: TetR family transcriptional regulator [Mesorhizobium sp.]
MAEELNAPRASAEKGHPSQAASDEPIRARNVLKILTAAVEIFSRKGLDGARIVEIAKASGLPKGNVYYYFSSKEEIYNAAIDRLIHSWDDAFRHISADREPGEAIEAYIRAKLDHARENAAETRLFANEILQGAVHLSTEARDHMRTVTSEKARVIDTWAMAGKIEKVDARHLFILLWSATQFYAEFEALACDALHVSQLKVADYNLAAKTITETVLRGLLTRPS